MVIRHIRSVDDVMKLLNAMFAPDADRWSTDGQDWWDGFYADRDKDVPFFVSKPDENLVSYLDRGLIEPGRALDLGCGPGRNAIYLAGKGFTVDAVDLSLPAVAWGEERARDAGVDVRFQCGDAFELRRNLGPYDLIYDSGCFHHLPPHRRVVYLDLLDRCLAPGGYFGLVCFAAGEDGMGSEVSDDDLYREGRLGGGLAYSAASLRWIFSGLTEVEVRRMRNDSPYFGEPFLWTALFRKS